MTRTVRTALLLPLALLTATACAVRLGGPSPEDYDALALQAAASETPAAVAQGIRDAGAELVLLSADRDTAWFMSVADQSGLELSGPGHTSGRGLGFLSNLELLGDTSLVLQVEGGGVVHMHDALYQVDKRRNIDLMMVRLDAPDVRAAVRALNSYIATDVGATAALLLAIEAADPAVADSAAVQLRAYLGNARECGDADTAAGTGVRLLYGPSARLTCLSARAVPAGVAARVQVQR